MDTRAYHIYTNAGSKYTARFDPIIEHEGTLYGDVIVVGYSEVTQSKLRMVGKSAEPEAGGKLRIESRPWVVEEVNGEEVPVYEYETIIKVEDITHLLGRLNATSEEEEKQEVCPTVVIRRDN